MVEDGGKRKMNTEGERVEDRGGKIERWREDTGMSLYKSIYTFLSI
jgi:hypothetical protein